MGFSLPGESNLRTYLHQNLRTPSGGEEGGGDGFDQLGDICRIGKDVNTWLVEIAE